MTYHHPIHALGAALLAVLSTAAAQADTTLTVRVDCTRGQSINAALNRNAEELIIEITGKCNEAVKIRRSRVTLRGTDPALDGLVGPVGDSVPLLEVQGADLGSRSGSGGVELENLSLSGGTDCGLFVADSSVALRNCLIADNNTGGGCGGAHFTRGSDARIRNSTFLRNGLAAVESTVSCQSCTFAEHPYAAFIVSGGGSHGTLANSTISGGSGAAAILQGDLHVLNTTITATNRAINVEQAQARVIGGSIAGQIVGDYRSLIRLENTTQTSNPFGNYLGQGSFVAVNASSLAGSTQLRGFSQGSIANGAHLGDLSCGTGADVTCDGSETKSSSSCGLCP